MVGKQIVLNFNKDGDSVSLTEEEFNSFIKPMVIPPHNANFKNNNISKKLWDFDQWYRENNLNKK